MDARKVWVWLRWPATVGLMALVVMYAATNLLDAVGNTVEFAVDDSAASPAPDDATAPILPDEVPDVAPPAAGPVTDGSAIATQDVAITGGAVADPESIGLRLGGNPADAVLVSFPLIDGTVTCIDTVTLELDVVAATETLLRVLPSAVFDLAALAQDARPPEPIVTEDNSEVLALTNGTPGRLRWDVTATYTDWVTNPAVPVGTPFVLGIRATQVDPEDPGATLASIEAGRELAPSLSWTGLAGCGTP